MTIVWYLVGALVALVVLMTLIGSLLARDHEAARTRHFSASPAAVWAVLRDVGRHPEWRRDVRGVEILPSEGGRARFREMSGQGSILYEIEVDDAPRQLVTRIADEKLPYGGSWTLELAPMDGGTDLTITERGFVKNPIFRFLSKTVFSPTASIDRYLAALDARLRGAPAAR